MSVKTDDDIQVFSNFKAARHPGLVIVWPMGSNQLHLMRMGGTNGSYKMQTKKHKSYTTAEGAYEAAVRWFKLLDKIYTTANDIEEVTSV